MRHNRAFMFAMASALLVARPAAAAEDAPQVGGSITFNGQPLDLGKISFHLDDDQFVGCKVKDGRYKVTLVPVGEWRVTIEGRGIPAKYTLEETSGLRVAIRAGANTINFELVE